MSLEELKAQAEKLGISVTDDSTEEVLKTQISEKEKALENDVEHWKSEAEKYKSEMQKAAQKRDTFKKDKDLLAQKIKTAEENMKGMISAEDLEAAKTELKDLKKFKSDIEAEQQAKELENATELEKAELRHKKALEDFNKELESKLAPLSAANEALKKEIEDTKREAKQLRLHGLEAQIVTEAAKLNAWNPSQVFHIVKDNFEFDSALGKYTHIAKDSKGKMVDEMSVSEFLESFLSKEENENLVKSKMNTSSFQTDKNKTDDKKTSSGKYNPKDPEIIKEAADRNMEPERYIKVVLETRDKIQKNKQAA